MIHAVIVDDERHNRAVLQTLLKKYCPEVSVLAEADSADDAFVKIYSLEPQLVFLDVKMPGKSGFDLLKMFTKISFEVIFVSAFNEYAIHAFEFNAIDYILKPIDYTKLAKSVAKAATKIGASLGGDAILHFIKTLDEKTELMNKFSLHHNGKVVLVNVADVEFIEAKTELCELNLCSGERYASSKGLKMFEDVLKESRNFIRINKSVLLNTDYMKSYTKGEVCIIELRSGHYFEVSRRKKTEIIGKLKSLPGSV